MKTRWMEEDYDCVNEVANELACLPAEIKIWQ